MKKVLSIFAIALLTLGMFSCEAETDVQDTESLFETLAQDQNSIDGQESNGEDRGDGQN